jgi:hypothetical protein
MPLSLAQKIIESNRLFVFYHTHEVTMDVLAKAIAEQKSMDLDICVDEKRNPYLGHSNEYYFKVSELRARSMPLWEAVDLIAGADIPVMLDCKHYDAWGCVEEVIGKIGPARCLVHTFISELRFPNIREDECEVLCEMSRARDLRYLKNKFPEITLTASAKGLPVDLFESEQHKPLLHYVRRTLAENHIDSVCLNIPDVMFTDESLSFFLQDNIISHVMIDKIDTSKLTKVFIGETDYLSSASEFIL